MTILEEIITYKREEVELRKKETPVSELEKSAFFNRSRLKLTEFLTNPDKTGIIAEYKRRSPSKGIINNWSTVEEVTSGYALHGASGLSVLTDLPSFGGTTDDLLLARKQAIPILRKDFMVDSYQLWEAAAMGADVILLIAACLSPAMVKDLAADAKKLGLEVLLEIHDDEELGHICDEVDLVGVNNRNLKSFTVDIQRSIDLAKRIGNEKIKIAESGIHSAAVVGRLRDAGFHGFLIGEAFMKEPDPTIAFAGFVQQIKQGLA